MYDSSTAEGEEIFANQQQEEKEYILTLQDRKKQS